MKQTAWIERKFNFDFPAGLFPNIMERLAGTLPRVKEMTQMLSEQDAEWKPGGKWSIKEQIGHLADLEMLHDGRISDFLERKPTLRAADMSNAATNQSQHNSKSLNEIINSFGNARQALISRFNMLNDDDHEFTSLHPRLKVMVRPVDIMYFIAEHDDHHLAAIRQILNLISSGKK